MSELKVYHCNEWHNEYTEFYIKSEADKVIAELKEKQKTEVKELLCLIRDKENNFYRAFDSEEKEIRHQKYKRCLAMADMCAERRMYWTYRLQDDGDKGYSKDYKFGKNCFWRKWCVRWLALADKLKEAK